MTAVALAMRAAGLSIIPIAGHDWVITTIDERTKEPVETSGRKKPAYMNGQGPKFFAWKRCQTSILSEPDIDRYFAKAPNIAIAYGAVSGFAECIDFDEPGVYEEWRAVLEENGHEALVNALCIQSTQTPGRYQAIYRCHSGVGHNRKLAQRPATEEEISKDPGQQMVEIIETRGEGGYSLVAPSEGYRIVQGSLDSLPNLSTDDRQLLLDTAAYLDRTPPETIAPDKAKTRVRNEGKTPLDDFDLRGDWHEVLSPHGWQPVRTRGGLTSWVRPGKSARDGTSATTGLGHHGPDMMVVFSSNAYPLEPAPMKYGKARAYAALNYGGDQSAAAKDLYAKGYGDRATGKNHVADERQAMTAVASDVPTDGAKKAPRWNLMKPSDLVATPDKRMLIEGLIGEQDRWMLFGSPGCAKSFTVLNLLVVCAVGGTFAHTFDVPEPLKVAYCSSEGQSAFKRRFAACLAQHGLNIEDVEENMRFVADVPQFFDSDGPSGVWGFVSQLEDEGFIPNIIVIDTLSTASLGSKEIDNSEAALICDVTFRIGKKLGCSTGFVHHTGWPAKKKKGEEQDDERPRGASAFHGAMDVMLSQSLDQETKAGRIRCFKGKDIEPFKPIPFDLDSAPEFKTAVVNFERANPAMADATALGAILIAMDTDLQRVWWSAGEIHEKAKGVGVKAIHNQLYRKSLHDADRLFMWDGEEKPKRYRRVKKGESQEVVTSESQEKSVTNWWSQESVTGGHAG